MKFATANVVMGLAFLLFLPMVGEGSNSAPLLGLMGILFLFTMAELFLSPVGLSASTKLAPKAFHTQMVALFFLSVALGNALAGTLAGYYNDKHETPYFLWIGVSSIAISIVIATVKSWVHKLIAGAL